MIHCYKLCGYNIVLDVASGSIHSVDDVAYDVIRSYELINDGKDRSVLINRILPNHVGITEDDILEVISDVEELKSQGKLFSPDTFAVIAVARQGDGSSVLFFVEKGEKRCKLNKTDEPSPCLPITALCLNVSHVCNMSCAYCFAGRGEYGCGEDDDTEIGDETESDNNAKLMSLETGKRAIDFLFENSGKGKNLDVDFFGGEPLLNWEVVKDIVRYAREKERVSDKKFRFTLTTNALLINDDVINFTNSQMHNVVLSLDGRPEVHDAMRRLPNGDGSYSDVIGKITKLVEARRGKGYYIRGTFTCENMDFVNDVLHIADLGFKEVSMEPVVGARQGDGSSVLFSEDKRNIPCKHNKTDEPSPCLDEPSPCLTPEDLPELFKQYETLAVEILRREELDRGFNFYHYNLDLANGPCVHKRITGCGVGTEYLAVTPSGELYPCHQFVGDSKFLIGDVWKGVTNTGLRSSFSACSIYSRSECKDCWARFYCSGGCAANAYYDSGSINGIYEIGCELFKKRIECAIMMYVARSNI
ncbi:MAG: SPASM domain-containing protein [Oscillospiraceae bacterium]|nr:SPASM domain-containing protein [Oscillospiraceae bacterium]